MGDSRGGLRGRLCGDGTWGILLGMGSLMVGY